MADSNSQWQIQIHCDNFTFTKANSMQQIQIHHIQYKFTKANSTPGFNLTHQIPGHLANSYSLWQIQIHYIKFKFRKANQIFKSPHQIQFHHGKFKFSKAISNSLQPGFYLGFFVWGKSILKKIFEPWRSAKKFFRPSRGSEGMLPRKILKI